MWERIHSVPYSDKTGWFPRKRQTQRERHSQIENEGEVAREKERMYVGENTFIHDLIVTRLGIHS